MSTALASQLERAKSELLDLTARNRLLNTSFGRSRSSRLDIVDELSQEIFRILAVEKREMSFLPASHRRAAKSIGYNMGGTDNTGESAENRRSSSLPSPLQPVDLAALSNSVSDSATLPPHLVDRNLQTELEDEVLQRRLLKLFYDARSSIEEQGVNTLYLALGFLEWYESSRSDVPRFAPLILLPVELHRQTVTAKFRLKILDQELSANLSLQARIKADFRLTLPDLPDFEDLSPNQYYAEVERCIAERPGWKVHPNRVVLWFFSFAKFLMFRDLDPEVWPEGKGPLANPLTRALLGETCDFQSAMFSEHDYLDEKLNPQNTCHVMDCDSSQAIAIEEIRNGRNLVIQGPPGTGKSQTISNAIAAAVRDGKTVLFISEKLAALEVVKARLTALGLGDVCLELHSHKANQRTVLEDIDHTWSLGQPKSIDVDDLSNHLLSVREQLNEYTHQLHLPFSRLERTPYDFIGRLGGLQAKDIRRFRGNIPDIHTYDAQQLAQHKGMLQDLSAKVAEIGVPRAHPWYGVERTEILLPSDVQALQADLTSLTTDLPKISALTRDVVKFIGVDWTASGHSFDSIQGLIRFATKLRKMPEMDRTALKHDVWNAQRNAIAQIVESGRQTSDNRKRLDEQVEPAAWDADLGKLRTDLAVAGKSWFRWLQPRWWSGMAILRAIVRSPIPATLNQRLALLDSMLESQTSIREFDTRTKQLGEAAFGTFWQGLGSDWDKLQAIERWEQECRDANAPQSFREAAARWEHCPSLEHALSELIKIFEPAWKRLRDLTKKLQWQWAVTLPNSGVRSLLQISIESISQQCEKWLENLSLLPSWLVYRQQLTDLERCGLASLIPEFEAGEVQRDAADRLELMICEAALRNIMQERKVIRQFNGMSHDRLVDTFRQLDQERIRLARHEVAVAHHERFPRGRDSGEVGILRGEIRKKRRHRPLRRLLADAGYAVQVIKPVFMMSPISVAQFLEPGGLEFDLLVIDEASQVRPVEALGAFARCRQAVVVGDDRQLPPTAFFDRIENAIEDDEPETYDTEAQDLESILDYCVARNFPQCMLRWHYRSRHHSLIAVSNQEFYNNRLFVVPSPEQNGMANRGLELRWIENGVFDRGGRRSNMLEAQAVAQAMIEHARRYPHLSLGVGAFSISQRDLILDELELLRKQHPETERFFTQSEYEPWFVKNLESVQGDERDTIFISIGYGPDAQGRLSMNFGPLNFQGGERRLNVLITRAKQRCVVFSSIRAHDIDLRRSQAFGLKALKTFLQYAETGQLEIALHTSRDFDSEFEAQVADVLRMHGWEFANQVGTAGFFIDLAVIDPRAPGRYLMGIECDGATYHSSRWARDRDRLRHAILEDHGWEIYRIWSTDWFHNRNQQIAKLLHRLNEVADSSSSANADSRACSHTANDNGGLEQHPQNRVTVIDRLDSKSDDDTNDTDTVPYREASFSVQVPFEAIPDLALPVLGQIVGRIVNHEGPIHAQEVARRVVTLTGGKRLNPRVERAVREALAWGVDQVGLQVEEDFYIVASQTAVHVRNREAVTSESLRRPEMLPPQEIDLAILEFVEDHISATWEETTRSVARRFGFRSTGAQIKSRIESRIARLVEVGKLVLDGSLLRAANKDDGQ
ncbi:MAG TPA: DUF3320 domain-containing protein [Pirellulaceae bacterium]|nr:DUF3320 domain-containing protein [Pirellulaceae bacterium]HMO92069.1 DUF3320 domain-containing protein [Pirellulaceae bacterium]HMP69943.1 DUF3320 domain-containing protein [Pirellulaceae bacterium]